MWFKNLEELDRMYGEWEARFPLERAATLAVVEPIKWLSYGQYVQFIQKIDWPIVADGMRSMGYNACSFHVTSAWGADPFMWPWLYDPGTKKFDLSWPNPKYKEHVYSFLRNMARNGIRVEIALHDGYYLKKSVDRGAARIHPYRQNKQGIDWSNDELSLPESKPWFTHVAWKTEGNGFAEHVVSYRIPPKYQWLWRYHRLWGQAILDVKQEYPRMPRVLVRYINENFARFDSEGNHQGGFGGEDKIFQVVQMEYEALGLRHGRDFVMVNDWMPWKGTDFLPEVWARAGLFDRHPNHRWFREVHSYQHEAKREVLEEMEAKYPALAHGKFVVRSFDGFKPESKLYSKILHATKEQADENMDAKVPSEPETHPQGEQIYYEHDFMKTFEKVKPVMKDIAK